jgi:putative membrane protein
MTYQSDVGNHVTVPGADAGRTTWQYRAVKKFALQVLVNAAAIALAAWLLHGIQITGSDTNHKIVTLLLVAAIFGVVNAFVRPVLKFLSFPIIILTLGLAIFVINALMLLLTDWLARKAGLGFHVHGFWTAVLGAIIVMIVSGLLNMALPDDD